MKNVVVIGGAGHVGLPFSIVLANTGKFNVTGIDLDSVKCHRLNGGEMIYVEDEGEESLKKALASGNLAFSADRSGEHLTAADVVAIMIGTPVDAENNPRLDDLFDYFENFLIPSLIANPKEKLILLRSTVNPGTTNLLSDMLDEQLPELHRAKIHLVFAPERVAQGHGITETGKLPQIIGVEYWQPDAWASAYDFFSVFVEDPTRGCKRLSIIEAEIAKLITNMARYVNFALANEFYMIADSFESPHHDVDINKIIDACNYNYPRLNLPKPGPNVGGPCLFKDGRFLTAGIPYGDLINTSFLINEGFVYYLFDKVYRKAAMDSRKNLTILGMTFKKDSDDIRNSLSFKLAKIAKQKGLNVTMCDPLWAGDSRNTEFNKAVDSADILFVMTPHTIFHELFEKRPKTDKWMWTVDVWKEFAFGNRITSDGINYVNL